MHSRSHIIARQVFSLSVPLALLFLSAGAWGQSVAGHIRRGNQAYADSAYKESELAYRQALRQDSTSRRARFNLGGALYAQGRHAEAEKQYIRTLQDAEMSDHQKATSLYNLGNSYFKQDKLQESVEAYKSALRLNPRHEDARYNLSEALRRLARSPQQQQGDGKQDPDQDQQQGSQSQQQEGQQSESGEQESQSEKGQDQRQEGQSSRQAQPESGEQEQGQQGESREGRSGQAQQGQGMTQEEAAQLLKALENQERKLQGKIKRDAEGGRPPRNSKDW